MMPVTDRFTQLEKIKILKLKAVIPKSLQKIETDYIDKTFLKNHLKVATYCYKKRGHKNFSWREKAKMITLL